MTTIPYTYTIVGEGPRSIDVEYSSPGHTTITIGVRKPRTGETLERVIAEFSPIMWWLEQAATFEPVEVGVQGSGEITIPDAPIELTPEEQLAAWRQSTVISQFQAHYTLKVWGLYEQVQALVASVGDPLELAFQRATEWRRNSEAILTLFNMLTLADGSTPTVEDVDRFFTEAGGYEV